MQELIDSVRKVGELQSKLSELRKCLFDLQQKMEEHGDKASIEAVVVYTGLVLAMQSISGKMFAVFKMGADVTNSLRKDRHEKSEEVFR